MRASAGGRLARARLRQPISAGSVARLLPLTDSFSSFVSWPSAGGSEPSRLPSSKRIFSADSCTTGPIASSRFWVSTKRCRLASPPSAGGRTAMRLLPASSVFTAGPSARALAGSSRRLESRKETMPVARQDFSLASLVLRAPEVAGDYCSPKKKNIWVQQKRLQVAASAADPAEL